MYFIVQIISFRIIINVHFFFTVDGTIFVCILFHSLCNESALQKPPNGYMVVECHPIISIPAPHDAVQYSEVSSFLLYIIIFMQPQK